jgi:hypothetical protein
VLNKKELYRLRLSTYGYPATARAHCDLEHRDTPPTYCVTGRIKTWRSST